jgi:hypothetical protein
VEAIESLQEALKRLHRVKFDTRGAVKCLAGARRELRAAEDCSPSPVSSRLKIYLAVLGDLRGTSALPQYTPHHDKQGNGVRRPGADRGRRLIDVPRRLGICGQFALSSVAATLIRIEPDKILIHFKTIAWSGDAMQYLQVCTLVYRSLGCAFQSSLRNHGCGALFEAKVANKNPCKIFTS